VTFGTIPEMHEEQTASRKPFQAEVAAAEKAVLPMVARIVCQMTCAVDDVWVESLMLCCLNRNSGAGPWRQR